MNIGYARVSTGDQTLNLQLDALKAAGCDRIFEETASGAKADRPVLKEATAYARSGDVLVVWRLDRLGRSLQLLLTTIAALAEQIDTTTPGGKLVFHLFGALAEFERDLIRERTNAGLAAARARGRLGGRPKKLADPKQLALAQQLYDAGQIVRRLGSRALRCIEQSILSDRTRRRRRSVDNGSFERHKKLDF